MDKEDAMEMILSVLSDSKHVELPHDLLESFLNFGITLLDGGNKKVQKTILPFFTSYPKSEIMFRRFYTFIRQQIERLKTEFEAAFFTRNAARSERISRTILDRSVDDVITRDKDIKARILEKMLRFLQLCTEGHNLDLQNYLRDQKHNFNSYDLVTTVSELLLVYSTRMIQGDYDNIIKCLDTLTDFVQGPCPENQATLLDSKFLEIAYKILNVTIDITFES